jgi:hypothetical protein
LSGSETRVVAAMGTIPPGFAALNPGYAYAHRFTHAGACRRDAGLIRRKVRARRGP